MTLHADTVERSDSATAEAEAEAEPDAPVESESGPARPPRSRRVVFGLVVTLVLLLADVVMVVAYGAYQAVLTPTFHLDGAFQTASGLLRLHDGDLPGRDFFPYLGIGPVVLLFPAFAASGGTLAGSVFSAWAMTAALLALLVGVVLALALRARTFAPVLAGAGLLLGVLALGQDRFLWAPPELQALLAPLFEFGIPGNSLRPIRASAPLILVAISALALTRFRRLPGLVAVGAAFGVVVACWSNDFALVPSFVVFVFVLHHGLRTRRWRLRELGVLAAAGAGGALVSGFALTGGFYVDYALYNFRDVLGDQFWYFGAWSPKYRVYGPDDLLDFMSQLGATPGVVLLVGLAILVLIRPSLRWSGIAAIGWATFAGGTVAMIGGHYDDYFLPLRVWTVVAGTAVVISVVRFGLEQIRRVPLSDRSRRAGLRGLSVVTGVATVSVVVLACAGAVKETHRAVTHRVEVGADPAMTYVPRLGGYLPTTFADHVDDAPAAGAFVEEYAGLWTALRGPNKQQKVDAVIHALGRERSPFARVLSDPATSRAVTTAPLMSLEWVSWNMSANWWYYRELLHEFQPSLSSPNTVTWRRAAGAADPVDGTCEVAADGQAVVVEPAAIGLNEIKVRYAGPGTGKRTFSMLQNGIDGAADARGFVALDPGARQQSVPVYAKSLEPKRYGLRDVPDRRTTTIIGCRVSSVPFPPGSTANEIYAPLWAADVSAADFTDVNYLNGVGRNVASVLVNRSAPNITAYKVGQAVRFADGQVRTVLESTPSYNWLVVYFDGPPLPQSILEEKVAFSPLDR